jgi:hypothetical protein
VLNEATIEFLEIGIGRGIMSKGVQKLAKEKQSKN